MAGDWIKMRVDLADDPAVIGIADKLGLDEFAVIGRLQVFWAWLDRQSRNGHAVGVTLAWLDRKVQRDGFAQAMVDVAWLLITPTGIQIPHFDHHNGATAKSRALTTNRKQKQRSAVTPDVTNESRHERDQNGTREEKRREEIKEEEKEKVARKRAPLFDASAIELPSNIDRELWQQWCAARLSAGKRIGALAAKLQLKSLAEFDAAGVTSRSVLEHAIASGNQGLYPPPRAVVNGCAPAETPWQRSKRERVHELTGGLASAKPPGQRPTTEVVDVVTAVALG